MAAFDLDDTSHWTNAPKVDTTPVQTYSGYESVAVFLAPLTREQKRRMHQLREIRAGHVPRWPP